MKWACDGRVGVWSVRAGKGRGWLQGTTTTRTRSDKPEMMRVVVGRASDDQGRGGNG